MVSGGMWSWRLWFWVGRYLGKLGRKFSFLYICLVYNLLLMGRKGFTVKESVSVARSTSEENFLRIVQWMLEDLPGERSIAVLI